MTPFTGKAALALTRKDTPARTIHTLTYSVSEVTEEEIAEAVKPSDVQAHDRGAPGMQQGK
jgi:exodeoxyribonuclease-5